jgi:NADH dehydrogenase
MNMETKLKIAVTGAYSYSGKYIARKLLNAGHRLITLTSKTNDPFDGKVPAFPFNFDDPERLTETLRGVDVLVNTYWVRFNHGSYTYHQAITNTRILFRAAKEAGVKRIVHVSIANPSVRSPLTYYWGKAILEEDLKASGLDYTILRPTVIFGEEDILINNIAWFLRHLPVFGTPGDGNYKLQPIYVEDMADLVFQAVSDTQNRVIDAIGPETYTFNELVTLIQRTVGSHALTLPMPNRLAYWATRVMGRLVGDVILTWEEVIGLTDNLLVTDSPPAGTTKLSDWMMEHREILGKKYANEIKRHFVPTGNVRS